MVKEYCPVCDEYTEHKTENEIKSCSICGQAFDEDGKRYVIVGEKTSEDYIKAKNTLLEQDPNAIIIPEEKAMKHRLEGIPTMGTLYNNYLASEEFERYEDIYKHYGFHGHHITYKRESPKIHRNEKCSCGSGKKYKNCCINN
jgi:hypothetical protein